VSKTEKKKKGKKERKKEECDKLSSSSMVGVLKEKSEGSELVLIVIVSDGCLNDKWIIDTTCKFHVP
jgi:hypothetical protein